MKNRIAQCSLLIAFLITGCNKNPFDRTRNASGGPTGSIAAGTYVIFNGELISGGGAFEYPGSDGQSLSFSDMSNPISQRSIRYSWTGQLVAGQNFAGFDLMDVPTQADYTAASNTGRDLHAANYTKVTFYARGSLSTDTLIKIEVADDGNPNTHDVNCLSLSTNGMLDAPDGTNTNCGRTQTLTSNWQSFSIPVTNASLIGIKDFFKATYIFLPSAGAPTGQGGTVYFDVIQYQP